MSTSSQGAAARAERVASRRRVRAARSRSPAPERFDVFLSHNSADKPIVVSLAEGLEALGIRPWLDQWFLPGGVNWPERLEAALAASTSCAILIGAHGLSDWQRQELWVAENKGARDHLYPVIPVLLPGVPDPFDPTILLPAFLATRTWVDLRAGIEGERKLRGLVAAIRNEPEGPRPRLEKTEAPYRGLAAFDENDADLFFGRAADVQRLLEKLKSSHFLAVIGPSGSGKSSLVRAGLLPALRHGELNSSETWPIRVFRPEATPVHVLATALGDLQSGDSSATAVEERKQLLQRGHDALHLIALNACRHKPGEQRLLLVVDQFEEIFTACSDDVVRRQFLDNLLYAATVPGGRVTVVVTLRADFYARCAEYPDLASQMAQQYLVAPISDAGLTQVIREPAARMGYALEPGLVEAIVQDTGRAAGALPLLQQALLELWKRRADGMLTLRAYQETGRVPGAVAQWAENVFKDLDAAEQAMAQSVLVRLVQPGDGTEDTRRRLTMQDLLTDAGSAAVEGLVQKLVKARLLTSGVTGLGGEQSVEITHEALIRNWPRLRQWVSEEHQWLLLLENVRQAAHDWVRHDRDPSYAFVGARLIELEAHLAGHETDLTVLEKEFWEASRVQEAAVKAQSEAYARGRYMRSLGELAGAAAGIAAGYAAAFGVPALTRALGESSNLLTAVLLVILEWLMWFAASMFIGLGIVLALRVRSRRTVWRVVMASCVGGALSLVVYMFLATALLGSDQGDTLQLVSAGALLGSGLGFGAALRRETNGRVLALAAGGLLGMLLAKLVGVIPWEWPTVIASGVLLGGFSSAGFLVTSTSGSEPETARSSPGATY